MCGRTRSFSRPLYLDILIHINVGAAQKKAYAMLSTNLSVVLSPPGHEIRMRLAQAHMAHRFPFLIGKRFGQMWSWNAGMTPFEGTLKTFWTGRESFALSSPPFSHSRLYLQHFFLLYPTAALWKRFCARTSASSTLITHLQLVAVDVRSYVRKFL